MILESQDIKLSISILHIKMIDNTGDRYMIFESRDIQLPINILHMKRIDNT
jgi:hypothetical protein